MYIKLLKQLASILFLALVFTSCSKEIDLDLDQEAFSRLIVEGSIVDDRDVQVIVLKTTMPYDDHHPCPAATGAMVTVDDGTTRHLFTEETAGVYKSNNFRGVPGKTYTLSIHYDGKDYHASSTMRPGLVIDSLSVSRFPYGFPANMPHYQLEIYGKEDPEPDQYYIFQYAKNDVWNDTLLSWSFFNDFAANGKYLNALPINVIDTDVEVFDVQVRALSVDQDYLLFIDQCIFNYMPNMFFSPPPATVTGNVSNGALGYFYAASVSVSGKIEVKREHYHTD